MGNCRDITWLLKIPIVLNTHQLLKIEIHIRNKCMKSKMYESNMPGHVKMLLES